MGLREEATMMIYQHGSPIIHCKLIDERHCSCVSSQGEPEAGCKLCKGLGLIYNNHVIKVMNRFTSDEQQRAFWGEMTESQRLFYMTYDVEPNVRDRILLVDLTANGKIKQPLVIKERYNITAVRPFRGPGGLLCYWAVKAEAGNA